LIRARIVGICDSVLVAVCGLGAAAHLGIVAGYARMLGAGVDVVAHAVAVAVAVDRARAAVQKHVYAARARLVYASIAVTRAVAVAILFRSQ
jgi:hypothetical protein